MKYIQYDYADENACWHVIFETGKQYDITFCDGIWTDDGGNRIVSDAPVDELTERVCDDCVAEILALDMYSTPETAREAKEQYGGWWQEHWQDMPEAEKAKYVKVAHDYMGWGNE